jgi:hypothetical protein
VLPVLALINGNSTIQSQQQLSQEDRNEASIVIASAKRPVIDRGKPLLRVAPNLYTSVATSQSADAKSFAMGSLLQG